MKNLLLSLLMACVAFPVSAKTILIGPNGSYANLSLAQDYIQAGDSVILEDGIYADGSQFLYNLTGSEAAPILIKAENLHGATFQGGTESIHLVNCTWITIDGFVITGQSGNGMNIDDGGDYDSPTHHITVTNCRFENMSANGNHDFLKLSGLDDFTISNCTFFNGSIGGGAGIDMVGCHHGTIENCSFDDTGTVGIQAKGGSQFIEIRHNTFQNIEQRALNLGGSTGLEFFRPPLPDPIENAFEAADLMVHSNIFIGNWAPIAFVGCVNTRVVNNTFFQPENWVFRILQENTVEGFLTCANNTFSNNIIFLSSDLTEVNVGPNTAPSTFAFSNNLWFNASDNNWTPEMPFLSAEQIIADPLFVDKENANFNLMLDSPAIGSGLNFVGVELDFNKQLYNQPPSRGAIEGNPVMLGENISDFVDALGLKLFPNPTSGKLWIETKQKMVQRELFHFQFIDQFGTVVFEMPLETKSQEIELPLGVSGLLFWRAIKMGQILDTGSLFVHDRF